MLCVTWKGIEGKEGRSDSVLNWLAVEKAENKNVGCKGAVVMSPGVTPSALKNEQVVISNHWKDVL